MLELFYLPLLEYISCILIIDAAVSSTDFLVTSITGHLYFLKVCIRSCRRGVPAFGGLISLPSIISNEGKDLLAHILKNNGIEEKRGVKDDSIPMFQEIGYITSGCRSIGTGQNIGISFCSMYLLYEYIDNGGEILLFRNRGSRIYRPAYFSIF